MVSEESGLQRPLALPTAPPLLLKGEGKRSAVVCCVGSVLAGHSSVRQNNRGRKEMELFSWSE